MDEVERTNADVDASDNVDADADDDANNDVDADGEALRDGLGAELDVAAMSPQETCFTVTSSHPKELKSAPAGCEAKSVK